MREELKELGLTSNEVEIYLLLLQNKALNPSEISQKLSFHRGYVYDALERMQEKEVVSHFLENNKKYFQAENPKELLEIFKFKLDNFQNIIPKLIELQRPNTEKTKVEVHKGKRAFRTLLKDVISSIKPGEEIYIVGVNDDITLEIEPIYIKQYFNLIEEMEVIEKIIIKKKGRKLESKNTIYREIDEKYIGEASEFIYGNKVTMFIPGTPFHILTIENHKVAETRKKQFELLWNIAE